MKSEGERVPEVVIVENENYRILKFVAGDDKVLVNDFWVGQVRYQVRLGGATARLERKTAFLFWPFWKRVEYTNIADVVDGWMQKYFKGIRLLNEPVVIGSGDE